MARLPLATLEAELDKQHQKHFERGLSQIVDRNGMLRSKMKTTKFNVGDTVTVNNGREQFLIESIDGPLAKLSDGTTCNLAHLHRASAAYVAEGDDLRVIQAVRDFSEAVMRSTKHEGLKSGLNKRERVAARVLLTIVLERRPTEEEIDAVIPG